MGINTKFNTCFFETYARLTLEKVLGESYKGLVNKDRPDLQRPDGSLGIEVTRAMEESKVAALELLKEMAGMDEADQRQDTVSEEIIKSGYTYGYGLDKELAVGSLEYDYWSLAQPLKRILASKISKVGSGFYGDFRAYGLYVFCKYDLTQEEVHLTVEYAKELQNNLDVRYSYLYLSQAERFYLCFLDEPPAGTILHPSPSYIEYEISPQMRKDLFLGSLHQLY